MTSCRYKDKETSRPRYKGEKVNPSLWPLMLKTESCLKLETFGRAEDLQVTESSGDGGMKASESNEESQRMERARL